MLALNILYIILCSGNAKAGSVPEKGRKETRLCYLPDAIRGGAKKLGKNASMKRCKNNHMLLTEQYPGVRFPNSKDEDVIGNMIYKLGA